MKQLYREVFFFTKNHLGAIVRLILPYMLITVIASVLLKRSGLTEMQAFLLSGFIGFSIQVFYTISVIKYLNRIIPQYEVVSTSVSAEEWRKLFIAKLMYTFSVFAGLFLFIIPGIIIFVRCCLVEFCVVLEKQTAVDAMKDSWEKTNDYVVEILGMFAIAIGCNFLLQALLQPLEAMGSEILKHVVLLVLQALIWVFYMVFFFRIYTLANTDKGREAS